MEFDTSHGFIQGHTHRVCQDYALDSAVTGLDLSVRHNPLIIVSDGCSSVPDTDVGARLLALSARQVVEPKIAGQLIPTLETFGAITANRACVMAESLGLPPVSCAATLLVGFVLDGVCHIYFFGDGVWFKRLRTGELIYTTVDAVATAGYLVLPNQEKQKVSVIEHPSGLSSSVYTKLFQDHWSFCADEVVEFGVASDGVCATNRSTSEIIEALSGNRIDYCIDKFLDTHPVLNDDIGIAAIRIKHR